MNSSQKCRCVRTASRKRTPCGLQKFSLATINSFWVMLFTRKVKALAKKVSFIKRNTRGISSKTHWFPKIDGMTGTITSIIF